MLASHVKRTFPLKVLFPCDKLSASDLMAFFVIVALILGTPSTFANDSVSNSWLTDADSDGIADAEEFGPDSVPRDTDSDGVPDYLDDDSDNDGISDQTESGQGQQCVGWICTHLVDVPRDYDDDSIPNYRDLDSDNDGISDEIEAGAYGVDSASGHYLDPSIQHEGARDSDADGVVDDFESREDHDSDGVPDYLDRDSDNDGLLDVEEGTPGQFNSFPDTDEDGITDQLDTDSDNDGLSDAFETSGKDLDNDGVIDNFQDEDGDGAHDAAGVIVHIDGDGRDDQKAYHGPPNHKDLDSDNDGITDVSESFGEFYDRDFDGFIDADIDIVQFNRVVDTDGDGVFNHLDVDRNNDGVFDLIDFGGSDVNQDGTVDYWTDSDGDTLSDWIDADSGSRFDHDNDGIANFADFDCFFSGTGLWENDNNTDGILDGYQLATKFHNNFGNISTTDNKFERFKPNLGYVHPLLPGQGAKEFDQFDANRNCLPDGEEVSTNEIDSISADTQISGMDTFVESPQSSDSQTEPDIGAARAFGSGSGCSIVPTQVHSGSSEHTAFDLALISILAVSMIGISIRRCSMSKCA